MLVRARHGCSPGRASPVCALQAVAAAMPTPCVRRVRDGNLPTSPRLAIPDGSARVPRAVDQTKAAIGARVLKILCRARQEHPGPVRRLLLARRPAPPWYRKPAIDTTLARMPTALSRQRHTRVL